MYFQIREVILWPRNVAFEPRCVSFAPGMLNVISGASRTGKSAVIPIIDYCLGSGSCKIPVTTIRDACSWFGVLVDTPAGQKLFARREPGTQRSTGDMFVLEGADLEVPTVTPERNASVESVRRALDELAGLTLLDFDPSGEAGGFTGRPSFRDMNAFIFQPQNLVANPDVLFFKAETHEHREKLRTIFPFVLNAVDARVLAAQHEAASLRRDLRRKEAEHANIEQVSQRWLAEIRSRLAEARELGLLSQPIPTDLSVDEMVALLEVAVSRPIEESQTTEETLTESVQELMQLRAEENVSSDEMLALRHRFFQMSELRESSNRYHEALQIQRDRLGIAEWLRSVHGPDHECPLCGSDFNEAEGLLDQWVVILQEVETAAGTVSTIPAAFDREYERIRSEIRTATERLQGVRSRIRALERTSDETRRRQYDLSSTSRFVGSVENALSIYRTLGQNGDLLQEIAALRERLAELAALIAENQVEARVYRARRQVEANVLRLLPSLDAERPDAPVELSIQDLTVRVMGPNRLDYLWELGSGSNWLSYHVAVSLALQQFFMSLPHSPVPSFLVYDQPSQVYFPRKLAVPVGGEDFDPSFEDEDVVAVRKIFATIDRVVGEANGGLQAIVLDHADAGVWGGLPHVHPVDEWRGGTKLVPLTWLT